MMDGFVSPRYERGYTCALSRENALEFRRRFNERNVIKASILCGAYIFSICLASAFSYYFIVQHGLGLAALSVTALMLLFATRQQRALENAVHFGSHYNFSRDKRTNDRLVDVLAAWPMLASVATYRTFHNEHHGQYGGHDDPCRRRFERMGIADLNLSSSPRLAFAVWRWLPGYVREYYRDVGSSSQQIGRFLIWHTTAFAILAWVLSVEFAAFTTAFWAFSQFFILPVVRSIAEVGEHDYERDDTEYGTTFSNIGFWDFVLFHPAGDAWHLLHHLYPAIPWWLQRKAHRYLMENDAAYRDGLHRKSLVASSHRTSTAAAEVGA